MSTKEEEDVSTNNRVNPIPKGYDYVTPHLMVKNSVNAIEFYKKVFGATEEYRFTMPDDDTKIIHAVLAPLMDAFWGDRYGQLKDPFGHIWEVATHKKDMTKEEMEKAANETFAKMSVNNSAKS
jgi:PhnB protein